MVGIYKITNQLNNKCYIGQSIDVDNRWKQHVQEAKNKCSNTKLYAAMRHYGIENFKFEILEECELNRQILDAKERYWIKYYNSIKNGYNIRSGGQNEGSWGYDPEKIRQLWDEGYSSGEIVNKIGCSKTLVQMRLLGYKDYNLHTSHTRGAKRAISEGKILTNKNSKAIHQYSLDGKYIASYNSVNEALRELGKYYDGAESNIVRSLKNPQQNFAFGYQWSREKVDKMPPVPNHAGKLVRCIETGQIFHSTVEAAKWANLKSKSGVRECCAGITKAAGKHPTTGATLHWEYVNKNDLGD